MTRIIADAALPTQLLNLTEVAEVCDERGRTLGYYHPLSPVQGGKPQSPFTDEEVERRRQQRSGRSLADIWKELDPS